MPLFNGRSSGPAKLLPFNKINTYSYLNNIKTNKQQQKKREWMQKWCKLFRGVGYCSEVFMFIRIHRNSHFNKKIFIFILSPYLNMEICSLVEKKKSLCLLLDSYLGLNLIKSLPIIIFVNILLGTENSIKHFFRMNNFSVLFFLFGMY